MSRHRNVKNLVDEDDYYYDDYDDDYDDYDDGYSGGASSMQAKKKKASYTPSKKAPTPVVKPKKKEVSIKKPPLSASAAVSANASPVLNEKSLTGTPTPPRAPNSPAPPVTSSSVPPPPPPTTLMASTKKPLLTVVILGHVDAGKSTVTGHLLHLQQQNTTTSTRKPTTSFAWLLDEDEQERLHGVTMDIATKHLETNSRDIILLDAPGHADFVPATITGAAAADAGILTVDVTESHNLQKGQLKEHVFLAKGLGVNQILILCNKMDVIGFDQEARYRTLEGQIREFLRTAGYPPTKIRCLPVSGLTGVNISRNPDNEDDQTLRKWYDGPTLFEALEKFDIPPQQSKLLEKPLRLVVADVIEGSNAISVRAKVVSGWVQQGEKLTLLPVGDTVSLNKVSTMHYANRTAFGSGELVDATLVGLSDAQRISIGSLLVRPSNRPPLASRCRAKVFVLDIGIPLIRGAQAMFHMHYLDIPCHFKSLLKTLETDGSTTKKLNPRALTKNTTAIVELQLSVPTCIEAFTECRALGRFVLRRNGDSVAVGRIEDVLN